MTWNIKIYESKEISKTSLHQIKEKETIRGLTESQKITIVSVLKRHNILYSVNRGKTT